MKFYQYLRGEDEGKIVTLNYVDDSDPTFVLYHFSDGFKCNENLVGGINDARAFDSGKILAEIPNENYKWRFEKKSIDMLHKKATGENGEVYEGADPYFFNKTGQQLHKKVEKVKAFPPSKYYGEVDPIKNYLKSFKDYQLTLLREKQDVEESTSEEVPAVLTSTTTQAPQIQEEKIESTTTAPVKPVLKKEDKPLTQNSVVEILIKSAEPKSANISFEINVNLPDKSLIEVIRKNYPESYIQDAFDYIINNLEVDDIKAAIKSSLETFYLSDNEDNNE